MKDRIKGWLKTTNRSRDWLGEKLGVTKRAVDNWLSSPKEIPAGKLSLIERLMQDDEAAEAQRRIQLLPKAQIFSLEVDLPSFRAYSAAALKANQTLEQWSIAELNAAAEAALAPPQHEENPSPPEDTSIETTERETEIGGHKVKIIAPTKYTPPPEQQNRAAEDPPKQE